MHMLTCTQALAALALATVVAAQSWQTPLRTLQLENQDDAPGMAVQSPLGIFPQPLYKASISTSTSFDWFNSPLMLKQNG
jgi:hypothetical protein